MRATDYFAIQHLIFRYADLVDRGDFEAVGRLFARAVVHMPGESMPAADREAEKMTALFRQWTRVYPETGTPRTRHVTTNVIIEPEGADRARSQSYVVVFQSAPGFTLQPVIAGTYYDRFAKAGGEWHFTERREEMDLFGDLSRHLLLPYGPEQASGKR